MQIVFTCDSTADLSPELYERYQISRVPLKVILGGRTYQDSIDIAPDEIYAYHDKTGELPHTAAANIEEYMTFFRQFTSQNKTVIHFSIGSQLSSSYNNARLAAAELENVYVVDSNNLSTGTGLLVLAAHDRYEKGMPAEQIVAEVNALVPYVDASFVLDSLDYLYKGGRCSALAAFGANLLKIKPLIQVKDGVLGVAKKYRGKFMDVARMYVEDKLANPEDMELNRIFITHAGCDEDLLKEVKKIVQSKLPNTEILLTRAGCTVSSHCGKNCFGVLFIRKSPLA
ncbi:MAG: DegV family protein [Clostridia bacterium]|nr:DegV family protein [Clostridia bacterium]